MPGFCHTGRLAIHVGVIEPATIEDRLSRW
jgi:hypothetical protein